MWSPSKPSLLIHDPPDDPTDDVNSRVADCRVAMKRLNPLDTLYYCHRQSSLFHRGLFVYEDEERENSRCLWIPIVGILVNPFSHRVISIYENEGHSDHTRYICLMLYPLSPPHPCYLRWEMYRVNRWELKFWFISGFKGINQIKRTPINSINNLIISKLNPLIVAYILPITPFRHTQFFLSSSFYF